MYRFIKKYYFLLNSGHENLPGSEWWSTKVGAKLVFDLVIF